VYLPLVLRPLPRAQSGEVARAMPGGAERILLVEDNPGVRKTMAMTLQALGYTVTVACDGMEALELVSAGLVVDLVLTDLSMPRLGGAAMAKRLAKRLANLPVMFMSGNLDVDELREQVELGHAQFLQKPVTLRELALAARAMLDPSRESQSR
jgi:CheY-like chemotaxis protein